MIIELNIAQKILNNNLIPLASIESSILKASEFFFKKGENSVAQDW